MSSDGRMTVQHSKNDPARFGVWVQRRELLSRGDAAGLSRHAANLSGARFDTHTNFHHAATVSYVAAYMHGCVPTGTFREPAMDVLFGHALVACGRILSRLQAPVNPVFGAFRDFSSMISSKFIDPDDFTTHLDTVVGSATAVVIPMGMICAAMLTFKTMCMVKDNNPIQDFGQFAVLIPMNVMMSSIALNTIERVYEKWYRRDVEGRRGEERYMATRAALDAAAVADEARREATHRLEAARRRREVMHKPREGMKRPDLPDNVVVPDALMCPITHALMWDPVFTNMGHVYEREAIEKHFKTSEVDPRSNLVVTTKALVPCYPIRDLADVFYDSNTAHAGPILNRIS